MRYYKFYIQKPNTLKLPRYTRFGHYNGGTNTIKTPNNDFYSLYDWEVPYKEKLMFNPFDKIKQVSTMLQIMMSNGFAVEIVTDGWADWSFDHEGDPDYNTVSPVDGNERRTALWRPCYQFFNKSEREFITDDGGTFEQWGNAYLESIHYYYTNKDRIYKGGFI